MKNKKSSRSHLMVRIQLKAQHKEQKNKRSSWMNLIDLAGSEAFDASSSYQRQQESKHINKSLLCLRNVIQAINGKKTNVPYRTSTLTKLLEPCLAGDAKMLMIVNIAPFQDCYKESLRSLEFASVVNKCDGSANYRK
ncbi:non-claret disjunctional [Carabus blaptoides fortunei]